MDQEKAKHLADLIIQSTSKIVPITPEFEEFFKKQKELDLQSLMGPNTHIAKHYLVDDKICLPQTLTRGYFEGRNIPFTKDDVFFTSFPKSGQSGKYFNDYNYSFT